MGPGQYQGAVRVGPTTGVIKALQLKLRRRIMKKVKLHRRVGGEEWTMIVWNREEKDND